MRLDGAALRHPRRGRAPGRPRLAAALGWLRLPVALALLLLLAACSGQGVLRLVPEVVQTLPHDPQAFTQGLVFHQGSFFESTGRYGRSDLRQVRIEDGSVVRSRPLEARFFAEGLALVGDRLIQLSYREQTALVYDRESFEEIERISYEGEGWGLCYDGTVLWMSDGSSSLQRRDAQSFELLGRLDVQLEGRAVPRLNELSCVGEHVYANVWLSNELVRIRTSDGRVDAVIDASALVPQEREVRLNPDAVLNGTAHDPATGRWWLTGKLWPVLYEVRWVPAR